ncbi:hypothetical protein [Lysinibacillus sp. K60]|uniref:hypothetical protein n=1 Tax=Lysinibacillus sp. K60 TaxID=2720027 RepID=UPI001C8C9BC1|nr:hypothetical protein [Lysinibacillus sp. K60]MBX8945889.1 CpsD/CapB family tyrosine-protein kinase [Lysinibacillus sp. K60]
MKLVQLLGSRSKADFAIYLGHTIADLGKRVLIVDSTNNLEYQHSYIHLEGNEELYEFQDVDLLINTKSLQDLMTKLNNANEMLENYDVIIVDANDSSTILNDWPKFHEVLYVSDNTRFTITQDIDILNDYVDSTGNTVLKRVHFESAHKIPNDYLDLLINNRLEFKLIDDPLEYDDLEHKLRNFMQHEGLIPYNKLPKDYRRLLKVIVTEMFDLGIKDFEASTRRGPFNFLFGRFKSKNKTNSESNLSNHEEDIKPDEQATLLVLNKTNQSTKDSNKPDDKMTSNKKTKEVVGG